MVNRNNKYRGTDSSATMVPFRRYYHLRHPSRHRIEDHDMLNWLKANRKALNAGRMKPERLEMFRRLLSLMEEDKRKNQYE